MVSLLGPSSMCSLDENKPQLQLQFNELHTLQDAVEPFTQRIIRTGNASVRLHCTLPTWCDTCVDLHDLHDLRARFLLFIHDLLQSLRSCNISASYCLAPANSSLCLIYALPPQFGVSQIKTADILQIAALKQRESVLLTDSMNGQCPSLIVT